MGDRLHVLTQITSVQPEPGENVIGEMKSTISACLR
jgi:hypothetical protein